jgi:hypothetical protein
MSEKVICKNRGHRVPYFYPPFIPIPAYGMGIPGGLFKNFVIGGLSPVWNIPHWTKCWLRERGKGERVVLFPFTLSPVFGPEETL